MIVPEWDVKSMSGNPPCSEFAVLTDFARFCYILLSLLSFAQFACGVVAFNMNVEWLWKMLKIVFFCAEYDLAGMVPAKSVQMSFVDAQISSFFVSLLRQEVTWIQVHLNIDYIERELWIFVSRAGTRAKRAVPARDEFPTRDYAFETKNSQKSLGWRRNLRQIKGKIVTPEGGRQQILNRCISINMDDGTKILAPACVAQKST